jgi:hypothetical protein
MRLISFISICLLIQTSVFCQFGNHRQATRIKSTTFENPYSYTFYVHNQNTTYVSNLSDSEFTWSEISYNSNRKAVKEKTTIKQIISDMELNNSEPGWSDTGIIESVSYYFYDSVDSLVKMETYSKNKLESVTFYEYDSVLLINMEISYGLIISNDSISYRGTVFYMCYKNTYKYDTLGRRVEEAFTQNPNWIQLKEYSYIDDLLSKISYSSNGPLSFSNSGWNHRLEDLYTYDASNQLISIQTYSYLIKMGVKSNEEWTEKKQRQPIYKYYDDKKPDRFNIITPSGSPARNPED